MARYRLDERTDIILHVGAACVAGKNVENRFRGEAGHGGASRVLESERKIATREVLLETLGLLRKEAWPRWIMGDDANRPTFQSE